MALVISSNQRKRKKLLQITAKSQKNRMFISAIAILSQYFQNIVDIVICDSDWQLPFEC